MNRIVLPLVALLLLCSPAIGQTSAPSGTRSKLGFTISRETTRLLGPVRPDGRMDYLAALDAAASAGVTGSNNAFALIVQVHDPQKFFPTVARDSILKALKVEPKGPFFVPLNEYARNLKDVDVEKLQTEFLGNTLKPWKASDRPVIAKWLEANDKPLATLVEASRRTRYYLPAYSLSGTPSDFELPSLAQARDAARALLARAMMRVGAGQIEAARDDLLALHRLGRLHQQGWTAIEWLVGTSIEAMALDGEFHLALSGELNYEGIERLMEGVQALPAGREAGDIVASSERLMLLDQIGRAAQVGPERVAAEIEAMLGGEKPAKLPDEVVLQNVDWDVALRLANQWMDKQVAAVRAPTAAERRQATADFQKDFEAFKAGVGAKAPAYQALLKEAAKGKGDPAAVSQAAADVLVTALLPHLTRLRALQDRNVARQAVVMTALAVNLCAAEKRAVPKTLDELKPKYLKAVPLDPYSDKPLVYKRTDGGWMLYSIGENLKDDGGKAYMDEDGNDVYTEGDIVIEGR